MSRHKHVYEMFGAIERVKSYANLVSFAQRKRNKVAIDDYTVADVATDVKNKPAAPARDPIDADQRQAHDVGEDEPHLTFAEVLLRRAAGIEPPEPPKRSRGLGR